MYYIKPKKMQYVAVLGTVSLILTYVIGWVAFIFIPGTLDSLFSISQPGEKKKRGSSACVTTITRGKHGFAWRKNKVPSPLYNKLVAAMSSDHITIINKRKKKRPLFSSGTLSTAKV